MRSQPCTRLHNAAQSGIRDGTTALDGTTPRMVRLLLRALRYRKLGDELDQEFRDRHSLKATKSEAASLSRKSSKNRT